MEAASLYNQISLPLMSLGDVALVLFLILPSAAVLGHFSGKLRRAALVAASKDINNVVDETALGTILALLGLLLAFSFGNALSLSQARKAAIVNEAAALGTAFLRADYLAEPGRTELKRALLAYSRTRIVPDDGSINSLQSAQAFLALTLEAQAKLWPLTLEVTADPTPPPIQTFVAGAMNDAIDAHLSRVETLSNPVSDITLAMMLAAALFALFLLGNRAGMSGSALTWRTFMLSGFLFMVMITILDTQRGSEGFVRVDDTTLKATIFDMEQAMSDNG